MELAKKITIDRARQTILINGAEFPYYVAQEGPQVENPCNRDDIPVVTIPVICEDVEIIPKSGG